MLDGFGNEDTEVELDLLKKYIYFARTKVSPRMSEESAQMVKNLYVEDRKQAAERKKSSKRTQFLFLLNFNIFQ